MSEQDAATERPVAAFPGGEGQPGMDPGDEQVTSEPLDTGRADGRDETIRQQNVGPGSQLGGGEFPDPAAPARDPAPGASGDDEGIDPDAPGRSVLSEDGDAVEPNEPA